VPQCLTAAGMLCSGHLGLQADGLCLLEGQCQCLSAVLPHPTRRVYVSGSFKGAPDNLSCTFPLAYSAAPSHVAHMHPYFGHLGRFPWPRMQHYLDYFKPP
jgi:hypothetical protein